MSGHNSQEEQNHKNPASRPRSSQSPNHLPRRGLRIALIVFAVMVTLGCGTMAGLYALYRITLGPSIQTFVRPVDRNSQELVVPPADYNTIAAGAWNILLLGSDDDAKFTFPYVLTQVMMIARVEPAHHQVHLISIPRDSWVRIPGMEGMHKIDQAFYLGAQREKSFEGGVRLARDTIEHAFGIPIHRYGWIGLNGFAEVIDIMGGVDVDITHPIVDDTYPHDVGQHSDPNDPYAYTRIYLAPGPQHLNGEQALEYVRSRHGDLVGDIGRTMRQQQVLKSLQAKLNGTELLNKLPQILQSLSGEVYTDLNQQEMLAFANFGRTLDSNSIQHITLGPGHGKQDYGHLDTVYDPQMGSYQSVIILHCDNIQPIINRIFSLGDVRSCRVDG